MFIVKLLTHIVPAILLYLCFLQAAGAAQTADVAAPTGGMFSEVVARLNGQPILGNDLEIIIRRELAAISNPEWRSLRAEYRNDLILSGITSLINSRLLYEKAVESGVKATGDEVDAEFQDIAKTFPNDAEMNAALARQFLTRDTLKRNLEVDLTVAKYITSLANAIDVTPEEVSKFYSENPSVFAHPDIVRASHILLQSEEKPEIDAKVKEQSEALLDRAKKGEDFAKLAKEYSVDLTASNGGDLGGYITRDAIDSEFADVIFTMSVNELRLVRSKAGYHIIKLTDKKPEGVSTLDEVRNDLTVLIRQQKAQANLADVVKQLQEKAIIELLISPGS